MNKVAEAYADIRKGSSGCCDANKSSMMVKKALMATDGQKGKMVLEAPKKEEKAEKPLKIEVPKEEPVTASAPAEAPRRRRVVEFVETYLQ